MSFHKCHIDSPYRSQTHTQLLTLASSRRRSQMHTGATCAPYSFARWKLPCRWTAICSSVYFTTECQLNWGRGDALSSPVFRTQMALTCLWLSDGQGAAEPPVSKDWWNPSASEGGAGLAPRALAYGTAVGCSVPRNVHVEFSVRLFSFA